MSLNQDGSVTLFIRALASYARVEAMKAENASRADKGLAFAYSEADFFAEANYLEELWRG